MEAEREFLGAERRRAQERGEKEKQQDQVHLKTP